MDRYSLVLNSLPQDPSVELIEQLKELGWVVGALPMVIVSGISDSEARIRKTDLEFLGAELEITPTETVKEKQPESKQPELSLAIDDNEFNELTLEVETAPVDFKLPVNKEELVASPTAPVWELSLDEPSAPSNARESAPSAETKKSETPSFAFSLEEEPESPPPAVSTPIPPIESKTEQTESFDLEIIPEAISIPPIEAAPSENKQSEVPIVELPTEEKQEISTNSLHDSNSEVEAAQNENEEEWLEIEEEELESKVESVSPKKRNILLGGSLLVIALLGGYIYLAPGTDLPEKSNDNSGLVTALLSEQDKILKEENKNALASLTKTAEKPTEFISGKFPIELSNSAINGEIRFGRYQAGLLIDSLTVIEEKQQKLTPQELADGKSARPWIKKFDAHLPSISSREPLGANYKFKSESRVYIEDSVGTLRIPCLIELDCEFKAGANLNCHYLIKNKALHKESDTSQIAQEQASSAGSGTKEVASTKTQLTIEREESLGFFVLISGAFTTKLNPL